MIDEHTSLEELAAIVSEALESAGITATLSGGAAVSIYSDNKYESEDLDFVTAAMVDELKAVIQVSDVYPFSITQRRNGTWSFREPHRASAEQI